MRKGQCITRCALILMTLAGCAEHEAVQDGWQADGSAARTSAMVGHLSTTVNSVEDLAFVDDKTDLLSTPVMLDANIVVASLADGRLLRIENGRPRWTHRAADGARYAARFAIDVDGTVYAADTRGRIVCIDAEGVVRWRAALRADAEVATVSDVALLEDRIVVAERGGMVAAFDRTRGRRLWSVDRGALRAARVCADAQRACVVLAGTPDTLLQIAPTGACTATPLPNTEVTAGPMLVRSDVVVAGRTSDTRDGAFGVTHAVRGDGAVAWSTVIGTIPQHVSASGDTVYVVATEPGAVASRASRVIAVGPQGRRLWGVWYDKAITSPLVIGNDAMVCTATEDVGMRWHDVMVLWRDGRIRRHIPFGAVPRALPLPVVAYDGTVMLGAADGCTLLRCTERLMYTILPQ